MLLKSIILCALTAFSLIKSSSFENGDIPVIEELEVVHKGKGVRPVKEKEVKSLFASSSSDDSSDSSSSEADISKEEKRRIRREKKEEKKKLEKFKKANKGLLKRVASQEKIEKPKDHPVEGEGEKKDCPYHQLLKMIGLKGSKKH